MLSENAVCYSRRFNLIPRLMFAGHSAELQALLPARKPTLRLRASALFRSHVHVSRCYDALYDLSPRRKKTKLLTARLFPSSPLLRSSTLSRKDLLFPTETVMSARSPAQFSQNRPCSMLSRHRCSQIITRVEEVYMAEKENTCRIKNELGSRTRRGNSHE